MQEDISTNNKKLEKETWSFASCLLSPFSSLCLLVPVTNTMSVGATIFDKYRREKSSFSLHHAFFRIGADGAGRNPAYDHRDNDIHDQGNNSNVQILHRLRQRREQGADAAAW